MSMSKTVRNMSQYCYCHPRDDFRKFRPDEGQFIANNSLFICHACLAKRHRSRPATVVPSVPPLVAEALDALLAAGYNPQYQYKLSRYSFDIGFPHLHMLIELDGLGAPPSRLARARNISKAALAKSKGWRVIHVFIGPDLVERILDAIFSAVSLNEQTD